MALKGICTFPGVGQILSATYTLSHGISPGVCILEIVPQATLAAAGGPLEFRYGPNRIVFPNCRVDKYSLRVNQSGRIVQLGIFDRRWKWAFGSVSGRWNAAVTALPGSEGTVDRRFRKTAQALAILLLEAMGEKHYDVRDMPTDVYPTVEWDAENPAQALATLADSCGCRVVMHLNGSIGLHKLGTGKPMPAGSVTEGGVGIDPPEVPDAVTVYTNPIRYQIDLPLYPVGLDTDGTIKPIQDLSYCPLPIPPGELGPRRTWEMTDPEFFGGLSTIAGGDGVRPPGGVPETNSPKDLAKRTVWKWYQVFLPGYPPARHWTGDKLKPDELPHVGKIKDIDQILPLDSEQARLYVHGGRNRYRPAQVFGIFHMRGAMFGDAGLDVLGNVTTRTEYKRGFRILGDIGIVEFDDPVFKCHRPLLIPEFRFIPAEIWLRTAFNARSFTTDGLVRYSKTRPVPGARWGTGPHVEKREIDVNYYATYTPGHRFRSWETNKDLAGGADEQLEYYLQATLAEYQSPAQAEATYIGLLPIDPDGAIQQVSWTVGSSGAVTRASRNSEFNLAIPSYTQRRFYERMRGDDIEDARRESRRIRREAHRRAARRR